MALVLVLCVGVILAISVLGQRADDRARARTAADAAALAGASSGLSDAERVARANGGSIQRSGTRDGEFEVEVRVGSAIAVARARRGW